MFIRECRQSKGTIVDFSLSDLYCWVRSNQLAEVVQDSFLSYDKIQQNISEKVQYKSDLPRNLFWFDCSFDLSVTFCFFCNYTYSMWLPFTASCSFVLTSSVSLKFSAISLRVWMLAWTEIAISAYSHYLKLFHDFCFKLPLTFWNLPLVKWFHLEDQFL